MARTDAQEAIRKENEACVMRIRGILHSRGDSITKMESALGFGNGTVGKWAKAPRVPPYDKLLLIGNYLHVSVGEIYPKLVQTENPATGEGDGDERNAKREEINRLLDAAPDWLQEQIHSLLKAEESGRTSQGGDPKAR